MSELDNFIALHEFQLRKQGVPEQLWPQLCEQLANQAFIAGEYVELSRFTDDSDEDEQQLSDLMCIAKHEMEPNSVLFLVDHSWSFMDVPSALQTIAQMPSLVSRLHAMLEIQPSSAHQSKTEKARYEAELLLKLCHMIDGYKYGDYGNSAIRSDGAAAPPQPPKPHVYFLPDEVGARIKRLPAAVSGTTLEPDSTHPNCRMAVIVHLPSGQPYSLVWPTIHISEGTVLCREYHAGPPHLSPSPDAGEGEDVLRLQIEKRLEELKKVNDDEVIGQDVKEGRAAASAPKLEVRVGVMPINASTAMGCLLKNSDSVTAAKLQQQLQEEPVSLSYQNLTLSHFPSGARRDAEACQAAAQKIAEECDLVLCFGAGDLAEELPAMQRVSRVQDVIAVLEVLHGNSSSSSNGNGRWHCPVLPGPKQQFHYRKVKYLKELVQASVPISPTVLISQADYQHHYEQQQQQLGGGHEVDEEDKQCEEAAVRAVAEAVAKQVVARSQRNWDMPRPFRLRPHTLFVKSDWHWCREGNTTVRLPLLQKIAQSLPTEVEGEAIGWAEKEKGKAGEKEVAAAIATTASALHAPLRLMFAQSQMGSTGVQIQPLLPCLSGRCQEYRGFFIQGQLKAVVGTYFRCDSSTTVMGVGHDAASAAAAAAAAASTVASGTAASTTDKTAVTSPGAVAGAGEILVIDYGLPADDKVMVRGVTVGDSSGADVTFGDIRKVMEAATHAMATGILGGRAPMCNRVDVAVDAGLVEADEEMQSVSTQVEGAGSGAVVVVEVESGLDFSMFPQQLLSVSMLEEVTSVMATSAANAIMKLL